MRRQSPLMANALRTVAVPNMILLVPIGALFAIAMEKPAGYVGAGVCWVGTLVVGAPVGRLDPYRHDPGWLPFEDDSQPTSEVRSRTRHGVGHDVNAAGLRRIRSLASVSGFQNRRHAAPTPGAATTPVHHIVAGIEMSRPSQHSVVGF